MRVDNMIKFDSNFIDISTNSAKIDYKLIKLASVKNIYLVELLACKLQQHTHQQLIDSNQHL